MNPHTVFSPLFGNMLFSAYFCVLFKPNPLSKTVRIHDMVTLHARGHRELRAREEHFLGVTVAHFFLYFALFLGKGLNSMA